ncbi:uncharacterized protein [Musca autumnalis]|uniref:uncharacterized protein n=1 Tax=Musca autumnalis TaxID=221902 RepID=UPI003CF6A9EB
MLATIANIPPPYDNLKCGEIFCVSLMPPAFNVTCSLCEEKTSFDKFVLHFESLHLTLAEESYILHELPVIEQNPIDIVDIKEEEDTPQNPIKEEELLEVNTDNIEPTNLIDNVNDDNEDNLDENKSLLEILKERKKSHKQKTESKEKGRPKKLQKEKCKTNEESSPPLTKDEIDGNISLLEILKDNNKNKQTKTKKRCRKPEKSKTSIENESKTEQPRTSFEKDESKEEISDFHYDDIGEEDDDSIKDADWIMTNQREGKKRGRKSKLETGGKNIENPLLCGIEEQETSFEKVEFKEESSAFHNEEDGDDSLKDADWIQDSHNEDEDSNDMPEVEYPKEIVQGPQFECITGLECNICGQPFTHISNMKRHRVRHNSNREWKCQQCPKAYYSVFQLRVHMSSHKEKPSETKYVCKCDICGQQFTHVSNMKHHRKRHSGIKDHKCTKCPKEFYTPRELRIHAASHIDKPKKIVYKYECPDCDQKFRVPRDLKGHQLKVHIGIKCDICGQSFSQLGNLRTHKLRHTGIKAYKCQECPKDFFTGKELKAHMLSHTGIWPHICEICGKRCRDGGVLSAHMRRHTGERPAKCLVCGKSFYSIHDLNVHSVTHKSERPFECDECGSKFRLRKALRIHKRTHLPPEERKHVCTICNKSFTQSGNLKKHMLVHGAGNTEDIAVETIVMAEDMQLDSLLQLE